MSQQSLRCGQRLPRRGVALLIVVSVLAVIGIMGAAFAFSMYLETQATQQFVSAGQARYVSEAGIAHGRALLDEDRLGSRVDDETEAWVQAIAGREADVDGDKTPDARWWMVRDASGRTVGRYALRMADEGGKANLNATQAQPPPFGVGSIHLTALLEQAGIGRASEVAQAIEQYRYGGPQGRPGEDGLDDDGDGAIDEADEYQPLALRGNDRRLEGLEDLAVIARLAPEEMRRLARLATVYSWDVNVGATGKTRVNVNTATAVELLAVLLEAGASDPWQAAVNMADYADPDLELSRVTRTSRTVMMDDNGPQGGWVWRAAPEAHYASEGPGGQGLSWSAHVPAGSYRLLARGLSGVKVGDVTIAGQITPSVDSGESLGVFELSGAVAVDVDNREPAGTPCAFRGLELVSEQAEGGVIVRGVEAVRINELMVEPTLDFAVASAQFDPQGSDWACPEGSVACLNSGVGQGRWVWVSDLLQPGRYYVRVFGASTGQTVGEVRVDGQAERLVHGQTHSATILVGGDGKVSLTIGKTDPGVTYYLGRVSLSLQPDGEYVELINMSGQDIDIGGWTIEGELAGGRQARLPLGSVIRARGLLLAAVDLDDQQAGLAGNGIQARSAWEIAGEADAIQLEFPSGGPSPNDDWLKATHPGGGGPTRLMLRGRGLVVDEVEYPLPAVAGFQSLEKGDPSVVVDDDLDGLDEGWHPSLRLYTPGQTNDNAGLKELVGLEPVVHDPSQEILVLNRPLSSIGELAGLPSGKPWRPFSSGDLARIVDRLTVEGLRLESEGRLTAGQDAWRERDGDYEHNRSQTPAVAGVWQWSGIPEGRYRLSLYGCEGCSGEQLSVRWRRKDGGFTEWSAQLSTDAQGRIVVGQLVIGMDETPADTLTLEILCASVNGICHVDHVRLDPQLARVGPVNVNTAPLEVLRSLPGMTDALASRILTHRPYGDQDGKGRGIGDLLVGDVLGTDEQDRLDVFQRLAHLLTTRSDVFSILSLGQTTDDDRVEATQRILTVVQR